MFQNPYQPSVGGRKAKFHIQFRKMNMAPLVNKPYVNEVTLNEQNLPYFCYYKTDFYIFFSVFSASYNQNSEDSYLINKPYEMRSL